MFPSSIRSLPHVLKPPRGTFAAPAGGAEEGPRSLQLQTSTHRPPPLPAAEGHQPPAASSGFTVAKSELEEIFSIFGYHKQPAGGLFPENVPSKSHGNVCVCVRQFQ